MTQTEQKPLTDAELMALASLVNVMAVGMAGDNQARLSQGYSPAWGSDCGDSDEETIIRAELKRRGVLQA